MSFDIAAYKKQHGTHDLEVVIAPDGGIAYAIPSLVMLSRKVLRYSPMMTKKL